MEEVRDFNQYKIEKRIYDKKELIGSIILKAIILFLLGFMLIYSLINSLDQIEFYFTYFEVVIIIFGFITYLISLFNEIKFYLKKNETNKNYIYVLKFMSLTSFILSFLGFILNIFPFLNTEGLDSILKYPLLLIHGVITIVLILSLIDYLLFDYNFKSKRYFIYLSLIIPFLYLVFIFVLSFSGFRWPSIINNEPSFAPYLFLDYEINGWFNSDYNGTDPMIGKYGFSVFYIILRGAVIILIISYLLLKFKNKKMIKKYQLLVDNFAYHQDI